MPVIKELYQQVIISSAAEMQFRYIFKECFNFRDHHTVKHFHVILIEHIR